MISGSSKLSTLWPPFADRVRLALREADAAGLNPVVTDAYRSLTTQRKLYEKHLRGGPKATRPGWSAHNYGLAVDCYAGSVVRAGFVYNRDQDRLREIFIRRGFETVSNDPPHFQYPGFNRWIAPLVNRTR